MRAQEALRAAIATLREAGVDDAPRDARILLAHAMDLRPDRLTLHLADEMTAEQTAGFDTVLAARAARQPVAQILGRRLFWGQQFRVTRDTLDPRPETEALVSAAVSCPIHKMLDLGTGTGAILLSCLKAMPMASGLGTDLSPAALEVAAANAQALGLAARARFQTADWFQGVSGVYDLIVSNPPYIAADEMAALAPEVLQWEPHLALTPGGDGLDAYRRIALGAPARLMPGGRLLVEIGPTQGAAVSALFAAQGLQSITILPDMDGRDRVVTAVKSGPSDRCGCT
ncbi:MAG: peptide chain release factor N(5)-glutamine methyltransferase [Paracoccaceae bacterium]